MSTLIINGKQIPVPGSWNDLTGQQLIAIAGVLHSRMSVDEAHLRVIMLLINPRRYWWLTWLLLFRLKPADRLDLLADWRLLAGFIFDAEKLDLTRQLIPYVKITAIMGRSQYLYGPPHRCKKLVFLEFIKAETYYLAYRKNFANEPKRLEALNKLIAVLYRHKQKITDMASWNGDIREVYNDNLIETRTRLTAKIPLPVKYAILMWYEGCRKLRTARYPDVFPTEKRSGTGGSGNWIESLRSMAGGALHMETMAMVDADTALYDLNQLIVESRKNQRRKP